ncbi:hypothetical protein [Blastococcus brunescens]|uniref:Uncharacterized protein n=1 Tax=Blastococcus brunescens TaxID=1564165 RepID=A0ABZ1B7P9_9ACTN|nr:hypothetical protein [Blastococcus sp. BMG 8361]WRL65838.1 hypothetical protein U6N30_09875 [Blastococcus sp. BMG 8361]
MADVTTTIGAPLDVVLPRSTAVPLSTNTGIPLLESEARDAVTRGLQTLLGRLLPEQADAAGSGSSGLSGLLGRIKAGGR